MSIDEIDKILNEEYEGYMDSLDSDGIYLSGPVRCVDDNGIEWRKEVIDNNPGLDFNNPLDNYSPEEEDILSDPAEFSEDSDRDQILPAEYVTEDKIMINDSEAVLLGLPENIARGSLMEAMYAHMRDIPIFVWTIEGQRESGWIFHHSEFMHSSREKVIEEIKDYMRENE